MWVFWICALLPIMIGGLLFFFNRRVSYKEWLITTGVALLMALTFQLISSSGMTDDVETWSGYVTSTRQYSRWREYYEEAVYRTEYYYETEYYTDSDGNRKSRRVQHSRRVFDHWESHRRWHEAHWEVTTTIGEFDITEEKYNYLCEKFQDKHPVEGRRRTGEHNSRMIDGDPNDYVANNKTGWIEPVTRTKYFENRVKAAPSLFSFVKVPTNTAVYNWPESKDLFVSDRVMGKARSSISTLKWDQMNAVLGARKKVNLIIIGFGNQSEDMANWQEAKWIGGKKNDVVICYGGEPNQKANWAKVFGWTESELVKENLQSILLENPINDDIIEKISKEVTQNYVIKDWHKFDYITIEPPAWSYWVYFIVMGVVQGGLMIFFNVNDLNREF